jgi:uncharacterized protein YdhG (YjbR/CyaY superfamily)
MTVVEDYLRGLPADQAAALRGIAAVVERTVRDAEQGMSYGMPAYKLDGRPLLGFTARAGHLSVHPFSPAAIDAVRSELAGFDVSKGTVRFTPDGPLPERVVERLLELRLAEIAAA